MFKETIKYTDYNGQERVMDCYFHYSETDFVYKELTGSFSAMLEDIVKTKDLPKLANLFRSLILDAYGIKSADGIRFERSPEISKAFEQTEAYNVLFMKLINDSKAAADFVTKLIPESIREKAISAVKKEEEENQLDLIK